MRTEIMQSVILVTGLSLVTYGLWGLSPQVACVALGAILLSGVVWTRLKGTSAEERE